MNSLFFMFVVSLDTYRNPTQNEDKFTLVVGGDNHKNEVEAYYQASKLSSEGNLNNLKFCFVCQESISFT